MKFLRRACEPHFLLFPRRDALSSCFPIASTVPHRDHYHADRIPDRQSEAKGVFRALN